jgi:methanogenic corrinoid protein MtbC1
MTIQDQLIEAIRQADRLRANTLLDAWSATHGVGQLFVEVLEPTLLRIGEEWRSRDSFTLAQAYVAAKIAEDVLLKMAQSAPPAGAAEPPLGPVVLGNIEDDFHALGRRMVGTFLRTKRWQVHDLGNDVTPATFVDEALAVGTRVIGVSAMMLSTARNIRRLREEIDRRGLAGRIQLAVGGAIFLVQPTLVQEVGGDGTAANALGAAEVFERLWQQSLRQERSS